LQTNASREPDDRPGYRRLVNLGTPDTTEYRSMRRYLKEFLSDRHVIEENRIIARLPRTNRHYLGCCDAQSAAAVGQGRSLGGVWPMAGQPSIVDILLQTP
jgi:hypothetical protein